MDVDFWAARIHSAKQIHGAQTARLNNSGHHLNMHNEGDEELRAWFPCPFCYVEIELPVFCSHLQEEHCFDLKNAVCPICAATLGRDAIGHFAVQHAHSIKRRKKSQKSGFWSNVSAHIVRDLRDLSSFLGTTSTNSRYTASEPAPDPLLSPFLCTAPHSDPKANQEDEITCLAATTDVDSSKSSLSEEVEEQDYEERRQRVAFVQELLVSTIFQDNLSSYY